MAVTMCTTISLSILHLQYYSVVYKHKMFYHNIADAMATLGWNQLHLYSARIDYSSIIFRIKGYFLKCLR